MKRVLCFWLMLSSFLIGNAQSDCKDALYNANLKYKSGQLKEGVEQLETCLSELKGDNRFEAYHLLAIMFQELNQPEKMDEAINQMLLLDPDYQDQPNTDPVSFTRALNQYKVTPKYQVGVRAGVNITSVQFVESFGPIKGINIYKPQTGYDVGVMIRKNLSRPIVLELDAQVAGTRIRHELDYNNGWNKIYTERLNWFGVRVGAAYNLPEFKQFRPWVGVYPGLDFLQKSTVNLDKVDPEGNVRLQYSKVATNERNAQQPVMGLRVGFQKKMTRGEIGFSVNYRMQFNQTVNAAQRGSNASFVYSTQYIEDGLKLNTLSYTLTYSLPWKFSVNKSN
ncbi:MAG: PorT family protein [Bacteroidetes bacterium]|nr:PorT family protein [Bacteroidota bacterium]